MMKYRPSQDSNDLRQCKYRSPVFEYVPPGLWDFSESVGPHTKSIGPQINAVTRTGNMPARIRLYSSDWTI